MQVEYNISSPRVSIAYTNTRILGVYTTAMSTYAILSSIESFSSSSHSTNVVPEVSLPISNTVLPQSNLLHNISIQIMLNRDKMHNDTLYWETQELKYRVALCYVSDRLIDVIT